MSGARGRILVAAIVGVVLLGPALALSLWSLRSIGLEQERLLEFEREQRRGRLRRAGERTHARVRELAAELRRAASAVDRRGRNRALRTLLDREQQLLEGLLQFGPNGEVVSSGDAGLVLPAGAPPSFERITAALEEGRRRERTVPPRPAEAADAYADAARAHEAEPAVAARCLAAASQAALTAAQYDRTLQFADAALDGPLRADAGWYAFTGDDDSPLAWTLLLQKVRALTALLAAGAPAMRRPVYQAERDAALQQLSELLARNELGVDAAALQVFIAAVEQAGGQAALEALKSRRASVRKLSSTRAAVAGALARNPGQAGVIVASTEPLRLMLVAPASVSAGGGVATSIRLAGLAGTFTDEAEATRTQPEESFRLLGPDGTPLPGQGGTLSDAATIELPLPGELSVLRAALWAPLGGGSIGAVGDLAKTAYIALGVATLVALIGGLLLFGRMLTREIRLARMRSDFISSVTHELRTPLTSIQMFVETLLLGRVDGEQEQRECLEVIGYEAGRLRRMIDRVLNFDRTERGARDYRLRGERLEQLVAGALRLFSAAEEGVRRGVDVQIDSELPPVRADREAIEEVLVNLLSNAAKYSPAHSPITLTAAATPNGRVQVRVTDQGMGIQPDERERIFQGFYRSERARERGVPGSGIGLALARQIARAHGGDLTVRSEPESGSTFMLELLSALDGPTAGPATTPAPSTTDAPPVSQETP